MTGDAVDEHSGDAARFRARPRATPAAGANADNKRLRTEIARLRERFSRAAAPGRAAFVAEGSDSYDIGMLAVIHLADLVHRQLPDSIAAVLPPSSREGLRATRNIAAHNYVGMDNSRLWETVTVHAPELLIAIDVAIMDRDGE